MKKYLGIISIIIITFSCEKVKTSSSELKNNVEIENNKQDTKINDLKLDFNNPNFNDRSEELIYIREYLRLNLPSLFLKKNPKTVKQMQEYYIADGRYYNMEYTSNTIINADNLCRKLTKKAIDENLSFIEVKNKLYDFIPFEDRRFKNYESGTTNENISIEESKPTKEVATEENNELSKILRSEDNSDGKEKNANSENNKNKVYLQQPVGMSSNYGELPNVPNYLGNFNNDIQNQLAYVSVPKLDRNIKIQIDCFIEIDGTISNITIKDDYGYPKFAQDIISAFKKLPSKWKPARCGDNPCIMKKTIFINFAS